MGSDESGEKIVKAATLKRSVAVIGAVHAIFLAADTSAAFSRTRKDSHVLCYVTTGTLFVHVRGNFTKPGNIVAIDISLLDKYHYI